MVDINNISILIVPFGKKMELGKYKFNKLNFLGDNYIAADIFCNIAEKSDIYKISYNKNKNPVCKRVFAFSFNDAATHLVKLNYETKNREIIEEDDGGDVEYFEIKKSKSIKIHFVFQKIVE